MYVLSAIVLVGRRALVRSLSVALLSSTLALALVEAATRVVGPHFPALPRVDEDNYRLSVYDPTKGWFHVPGGEGAVPVPGGGPAHVRINQLGLRGPEVAVRKPAGVVRILVLGDSFAFGMGVDEPHLFTTQLERSLEAETSSDFEVVNLGVLGYATDQELILFQELGVRLSPDLVILLMCDNDFEGNLQDFAYRRYYKPYFELDGEGVLRARNQPVPRLDRPQRIKLFLGQESNLWNALRSVRHAPPFLQVAVPRPSSADPVRLAAALVRSLDSIVEAVGARLLVLNTGHRGERTPLFHALRPRLQGIEQLGLEGPLLRARHGAPDRAWDFPQDTHWNRDSHQLAAQVVARHLVRHGLVPLPGAAPGGR